LRFVSAGVTNVADDNASESVVEHDGNSSTSQVVFSYILQFLDAFSLQKKILHILPFVWLSL